MGGNVEVTGLNLVEYTSDLQGWIQKIQKKRERVRFQPLPPSEKLNFQEIQHTTSCEYLRCKVK